MLTYNQYFQWVIQVQNTSIIIWSLIIILQTIHHDITSSNWIFKEKDYILSHSASLHQQHPMHSGTKIKPCVILHKSITNNWNKNTKKPQCHHQDFVYSSPAVGSGGHRGQCPKSCPWWPPCQFGSGWRAFVGRLWI